jgi:hypothetical protein
VELCTDINTCKIKNWEEGNKTELAEGSPYRRRKPALDSSANLRIGGGGGGEEEELCLFFPELIQNNGRRVR